VRHCFSANWQRSNLPTLFLFPRTNETDVEKRLISFSVEWFKHVNWIANTPNIHSVQKTLRIIADDFLLGKDNTLGKNKPLIHAAFEH